MSENKQKSVLIIENDDAILSSLSNRFKQKDMLVITAKDGYEGYTRACKESPDLIVSETLLPSMNGFRVARLLNLMNGLETLHSFSSPVIMWTRFRIYLKQAVQTKY